MLEALNFTRGGGIGLFYGGTIDNTSKPSDICIRISSKGSMLATSSSVGTPRHSGTGTNYGSFLAIFHGGGDNPPTVRISRDGNIVGTEVNVGDERRYLMSAGLSPNLGLFYGGFNNVLGGVSNLCLRLSSSAVTVGNSTNVGTARGVGAGVGLSTNLSLFYAGNTEVAFGGGIEVNTVTRINNNGVIIGDEFSSSQRIYRHAGAGLGNGLSLFYGGAVGAVSSNVVAGLNDDGSEVLLEASIGTAREALSGGGLSSNLGLFWAGQDRTATSPVDTNVVTRIGRSATLIGLEINIGPITRVGSGVGLR